MKEVPAWVWYKLGFNPNDSYDWINMGLIPEHEIQKVLQEGP